MEKKKKLAGEARGVGGTGVDTKDPRRVRKKAQSCLKRRRKLAVELLLCPA